MKATVKVSPTLLFEIQTETQKSMFQELAALQEVFSNTTCKRCGSEARFVVRTVDDNDFYEMRCTNEKCRARLHYGLNKKGETVFPKRKTDDNKYHEFAGWMIWDKDAGKEI